MGPRRICILVSLLALCATGSADSAPGASTTTPAPGVSTTTFTGVQLHKDTPPEKGSNTTAPTAGGGWTANASTHNDRDLGTSDTVPVAILNSSNTCGGSSTALPQELCDAWGDFYDSTGGPNWKYCSKLRADPCACDGAFKGQVSTCNGDRDDIVGL
jgi:hypothetical protein